jgi:hypothetical protein
MEALLLEGAYHLAVQWKQQSWNSIWCLDTTASLKNFTWKVSHNLLPTKANLFRKHIIANSLCPICTLSSETTFHILWSCPSFMAVWQEGSRWL